MGLDWGERDISGDLLQFLLVKYFAVGELMLVCLLCA